MPKKEEEEILPTAEQVEAYAERVRAFRSLAKMDALFASLPNGQVQAHLLQPSCVVVASLGSSMVAVEYGERVGIVVPTVHAQWIEDFPFDFVAVTSEEIFFVSKSFAWLGSEIPTIGISLGPMIAGTLLARLCNQGDIDFLQEDSNNIALPNGGTKLRSGRSTLVYQVPDGIDVLKTRTHFEAQSRTTSVDRSVALQNHFLG